MKHITIQEEARSWWHGIFLPSVIALMAYVESLEGLEFKSFHYVMQTDELDVKGTFLGHNFNIFMEWGGAISLTFNTEVPEALASVLDKHMKAYKYVGSRAEKLAAERFQRLAIHGN